MRASDLIGKGFKYEDLTAPVNVIQKVVRGRLSEFSKSLPDCMQNDINSRELAALYI